jgi:hypothetical protein
LAVVCTLLAVAGGSAGTQAEDIRFSDSAVTPVAYEKAVPYEVGAIRAAFLSDEPVVIDREVQQAGGLKAPMKGGPVRCSTAAECAGSCEIVHGAGYDVAPNGGCATCTDGCPSCNGSATCNCDMCQISDSCEGPGGVYYAEVQIMWLRAHLLEDAVGKLSEKYEWSPRLVAGYENAHGIGGRGRWWHYSHETPILGGDDIRFRFDVIDVEATSRFAMRKADLVVSGGMRWADVEVEFDDDAISTGAPGLTAAADLRVELCRKCNAQWAAIGGARFSTLGGDWDGDGGFIDDVRDDNITVQELYIGAEYTYQTKGGYHLFTRLTYEIQNWHSDAFSQDAGADSVGFVGPGIHAGASF